jgi:hypothetical protein
MIASFLNTENARLFFMVFFIILIYGGLGTLLIVCLIRFAKFLGSVPKEQKLLRMELGKLAEEVHQIRNELKADKK